MCAGFRVGDGCFSHFEHLKKLSGGGVGKGAFRSAGAEEPSGFKGEKVGFGGGVGGFGFCPSRVEEVEDVER